MRKTRFLPDNGILDKISSSSKMSESEKISFLKYVGYMSGQEKKELSLII